MYENVWYLYAHITNVWMNECVSKMNLWEISVLAWWRIERLRLRVIEHDIIVSFWLINFVNMMSLWVDEPVSKLIMGYLRQKKIIDTSKVLTTSLQFSFCRHPTNATNSSYLIVATAYLQCLTMCNSLWLF